jgi:hypothetical protein
MIKLSCTFRFIPEFSCLEQTESTKMKLGRYHGSHFPGVPENHYPIACYFDGNVAEAKENGMSDEEIVESVLSILNIPEGRKKKLPYGHLTKFRQETTIKNGVTFMTVILLTSEKKSKHFWGEGENASRLPRRMK